MKTLLISFAITFSLSSFGQQSTPVTLWTDANAHGYSQHLDLEEGTDHLRPEMCGRISAVAVAAGYSITLFDGEDGEGRDIVVINGPSRIDDLKTVARLHGKGNWDDSVRSVRIERTKAQSRQVPAPELASRTTN